MTDQKAEALKWTEDSPINPLSSEVPGIIESRKIELAQAQVHATLYLAEQLRIANLITVAGWVMDSTKEDVGYDLDKLRVGIAGEVWEGLGLS